MHGWTGACKRHVSVYDSAYVHKFRYPRTLRETSAKVTFFFFLFAANVMTHKGLSRSLILAINLIPIYIIVAIRIIIGIIITYTDTTYKHVNNKINRIESAVR